MTYDVDTLFEYGFHVEKECRSSRSSKTRPHSGIGLKICGCSWSRCSVRSAGLKDKKKAKEKNTLPKKEIKQTNRKK